jgi:hypothetical protein
VRSAAPIDATARGTNGTDGMGSLRFDGDWPFRKEGTHGQRTKAVEIPPRKASPTRSQTWSVTLQFKALHPNIEVNGRTVFAIVDAFTLKKIPSQILLAEGIGEPTAGGVVAVAPERWYLQQAWLRAFERIATEIGHGALYAIGLRIPENAAFPPWVKDIDGAIRSIDVAYHLNHRREGRVMFDPSSGTMLEGIGHYGYTRIAGQRTIVSECNNPYPCDFDAGILAAMAKRFEKTAVVTHDRTGMCRNKGHDSCTYVVTW